MNVAREYVIAGNWKLNNGGLEGLKLAAAVRDASKGLSKAKIVVAPPFTALAAIGAELEGSQVELSAQNLYPKDSGAFTGEVSAPMLKEAGCKWVILGHSERRQFFGETDEGVREKVAAAMAAGLRPIACVGETLAEREAGKTLEVVFRQLDAFVGELAKKPGFGVIAYEPVWAIGTGKVAGPEQAQEVHGAIRERLKATSAELADVTAVLYGGSVKADNAAGLLGCPDIDGALVGGASLDAAGFAKIAAAVP
ncbi:MAG TPA: triose-phosphate isomerase [Polyangiaceae bacterium]|jgi:triosephosphate isomerase|nr:triose-phosphate isomerase [Polyangiaceae bacterium]